MVFLKQDPFYDSTKPNVVGTQKNGLAEIFLSTHNIGFQCQISVFEFELLTFSKAFPPIDAF